MNVRGNVYNAAQANTFECKPTIDNSRILVDIYIRTYIYIHTYKRDLRIAAHLLHVYSPITNALSNKTHPVMSLWLSLSLSFNNHVNHTKIFFTVIHTGNDKESIMLL